MDEDPKTIVKYNFLFKKIAVQTFEEKKQSFFLLENLFEGIETHDLEKFRDKIVALESVSEPNPYPNSKKIVDPKPKKNFRIYKSAKLRSIFIPTSCLLLVPVQLKTGFKM
jgi:hypothetical protein